MRSPLIAWGPGLISKERRGTTNTTSVFAAIDLVPSLLELAGVAAPAGVVFDGENLADTLVGKADVHGSDASLLLGDHPTERTSPTSRTCPTWPFAKPTGSCSATTAAKTLDYITWTPIRRNQKTSPTRIQNGHNI